MIIDVHVGDDADLIQKILAMHGPKNRHPGEPCRVLDMTYGKGRFWEKNSLQRDNRWTVYGLDERNLTPTTPDPTHHRVTARWSALPFAAKTMDVIVIDPPFLVHAAGTSIIKQRYTSPANYPKLLASLEAAAPEARRVMTDSGVIIAKTMDTIDGRQRRWLHHDIKDLWEPDLYLIDNFVSIAHSNIRDPHWTNQRRSRAAHCNFMIFAKRLRRRQRD